jgi:1-aminocyclopropane-1-carboxylate deaminase
MTAVINALVNLQLAVVQKLTLPALAANNITAGVLRIDKIHATVSGNKWFKLKYALREAMSLHKNTIVTFGGAYSNHLVATAYACAQLGLQAIGIVRGEQPAELSPALHDCLGYGMKLHFVSRDEYREKNVEYPHAYIIQEGGCGELGVKGAADILELAPQNEYSHICCAVGTGTMMAGLITGANNGQQVEGFSALKLPANNSIEQFIQQATGRKDNYSIHYDYHFGGYARKTPQLINFMNDFYSQTGIPLDFVYTAKLLYGVLDLAGKGFFPNGSRLLIIHSGGLQGNRSLPKNSLAY